MVERLENAFKAKYPKYWEKILTAYMECNDCGTEWNDITKVRLAKFVDYLSDSLAPNSVKTYCAMFKAVLSLYSDEVSLPNDYAKILSVKGCVAQNTWLTDDEIMSLISMRLTDEVERLVRDQFILGCLTGARHSDYTRFTKENIVGKTLVYVSKKTHIKSEVPLSPIVGEILRGDVSRSVCDPTFNETIRRLCRRAGICAKVKLFKGGVDVEGHKWEFVSSHTARRSFATNVYLQCHDILAVSRMLGHSSVDMTMKYICTTEIPEELREYFAQFGK